MFTRRLIGMLGLLALATAAVAQDDKKDAKKVVDLPPDVVPATFRAQMVVDDRFPPKVNPPVKPEDRDPKDRTNKLHCLVCENGLSPTVAVFVRAPLAAEVNGQRQLVVGPESGLGKLIKATDLLLPKYRGDKLCGYVMFLQLDGGKKLVKVTQPDGSVATEELDLEYPDDEKRDVYAKEIKDFSNAVKAPTLPFGLAATKSKAIADWKIADADEVTVVIYNRLRIVQRWSLKATDIGDDKIKEILTATEAMITGKK